MKTVPLSEFLKMLDAQQVTRNHLAFRCPRCQCVQSISDFTDADPSMTADDAANYIGFSCVGRITKAGPPRKEPDGSPCNWSLGGLFQLHDFSVITDDGKNNPHFEPVSREEAHALMARKGRSLVGTKDNDNIQTKQRAAQ